MGSTVFLNGEYIPHEKASIHVEDRGFTLADVLYEVFRIYGGLESQLMRLLENGGEPDAMTVPYERYGTRF